MAALLTERVEWPLPTGWLTFRNTIFPKPARGSMSRDREFARLVVMAKSRR